MTNDSKYEKVPYVFFTIENDTDLNLDTIDTIGLEADVHSINLEGGRDFIPEEIYTTGKLNLDKQVKKYID